MIDGVTNIILGWQTVNFKEKKILPVEIPVYLKEKSRQN